MYVRSRRGLLAIPALLLALAFPLTVLPQNTRSRALVTQPVNNNVLHRLAGKESGIRLALGALLDLPLREIRASREFTALPESEL